MSDSCWLVSNYNTALPGYGEIARNKNEDKPEDHEALGDAAGREGELVCHLVDDEPSADEQASEQAEEEEGESFGHGSSFTRVQARLLIM